ncbi:DUF2179 domain-containing protein [Sediminispirochaeta smaragdinae]|jgi:uncharacterized protein YebE (UPF0316 family)|uniref:UPF0316 protein Spirs_1193 n=1 Tax=Sediminispirochaeta smaragdinae (strain DSM 11293 / JCM 15392 / SEBR 4228) TaxID=573413 RepID=E1R2P0_SEDSS|nr:DUF2179 domain-containing protein [Sediminispirochaeta smaragdinae]ADK80322.1 Protein of unknown function DUF2179 [Sediminispirochaeta smaragdinae DSM 11293]
MSFIPEPIFSWVVLPLLIFFARIADVTIGTMRIVFVARGQKLIAPLLGFFEVLIWLIALTKIMQNLGNPVTYFAYGAGFAMGNFIGITLEARLAFGMCIIRTITRQDAHDVVEKLRDEGYGVTVIDANGNFGKVSVFYSVVKRSHIDHFVGIIKSYNPKAFYTIEDVRVVNEGFYPKRSSLRRRPLRKGK